MRTLLTVTALGLSGTLLAGCGGSSSSASSTDTTPASSDTSAGTPAATGTAPADPAAAKSEITANWEKFFASDTSPAAAKSLLENGDGMGAALKKAQQEDKAAGGTRSATVKKVTFSSPTQASVTYTLVAAGQTLPASGVAVLQDGTWKVSDITFCTLVVLGNNGSPVPGCPS